jgi:methylated-DNA-[protein]-cysteine S-methyltransferase
MTTYTCFQTTWGTVSFAATDKGVCGLCLPLASVRRVEQIARRRWPGAERRPDLMKGLQRRIAAYFSGERARFTVPVDLTGLTEFQQAALRACLSIPYGVTTTYGRLAAMVGRAGAARAVGRAMARNPIPLIIPCHRVLAAGGDLGGFSAEGGVEVKSRMLRLEGAL